MKKVLLSSAAIIGLASMSTPAAAQVQLELGGYFKGYGAYVSQDEDPDNVATAADDSREINNFDIIRATEVHFSGETTLDNGLTVGAHIETEADGGDGFEVEESYVYFSGGWGRVNFGAEDGAQYLLQVEAPSADSNIDGLRQLVNPVNYDVLTAGGEATILSNANFIANMGNIANGAVLDYAADATGYNDKITYLSPIVNGFQAGVSYTPDNGYANSFQVGYDDVIDTYGDAYEAGLRYEGQFNNIGLILGAGYTHVNLEDKGSTVFGGANAVIVGDPTDDRNVWNVGADVNIGPFGIGAAYMNDDLGEVTQAAAVNAATPAVTGDDQETWVVGVDYTTGPFKLGASYMNVDNTFGVNDLETDRYSAGVTYTYGPGMTFRGSVGYVEHDGTGIGGNLNTGTGVTRNNVDATYVTLGTQINF